MGSRTIIAAGLAATTLAPAAGDPSALATAEPALVRLRHGSFDPLSTDPGPLVAGDLAAGTDTNVYIVQLTGRTRAEDLDAIRALGGVVHGFLPDRSHLVRLDPDARRAIADLPFVRGVGPYHPEYRLDPELIPVTGASAPARFGIQLFERGPAPQGRVAEAVRALGGSVLRRSPHGFRMEARLDGAALRQLARSDDVAFIDRAGAYEHDLDIVREVVGANFLEEVAGLTGHGVRGEIIDLGVLASHCDLQSNPILFHTRNPGRGILGTAVIGAAFGDGTCNPQARGLLPDGSPIFADFLAVEDLHAHVAELVDPDGPYRAVFQSRSLGRPRSRSYTTISAEIDDVLFTHDIVMTQSMSNAGRAEARPEAWAKNIVSVGGVLHRGTATKADDCWCGVASTGPAEDGRIKPDLVHFVDGIFTTGGGCDTCYGEVGGTSISTPIVAGAAGLVLQMWSEGLFGNPAPPGDVFDNRPHMTTTKALLVNTASRYPFDGAGHDLTRTHQGWGLPDLRSAYERRGGVSVVDESVLLALDERYEASVDVGAGAPDLRVTLVYADPPGLPGASRHRVNDLSLLVTSPAGVSYWGNHGLREGNWSTPGGAPDDRDTVENVFVAEPEPGPWSVEVIAFEINEDGHVETPALDADFALVVSGGRLPAPCRADLDDSGAVDVADLVAVLTAWGPYDPCPPFAREDLDEGCAVGASDLLIVLATWGPCE